MPSPKLLSMDAATRERAGPALVSCWNKVIWELLLILTFYDLRMCAAISVETWSPGGVSLFASMKSWTTDLLTRFSRTDQLSVLLIHSSVASQSLTETEVSVCRNAIPLGPLKLVKP